jgi:EAL domain-containing protein (putative c-di-GMP-specific phosphodiesterase class I)
MRHAVAESGTIKKVMLIAPDGAAMCDSAGGQLVQMNVLGTATSATTDIMLDVVQSRGGDARFLRVRKLGGPNKPGMAALVPASALMPHGSPLGSRSHGLLRLMMTDGTPVAAFGVAPQSLGALYVVRMQSQQYPLTVTAAMERKGVIAGSDDLSRIATVASAVAALLVLLAAAAAFWRRPDNPIAEVTKAMLADEFVPFYQPIVDIQTGRLLGAEVLARWRRSDGSLVEPITFVSVMELSGLVQEFTRSLMRQTRNELGDAIGRRPDLTIAFNVAPQHFDDALILNDIGTIFDGSPIKLNQVVLELTEHYRFKDVSGMRRTVAALQGLGCKIAIDDIGAGHNGLSYIIKLGVDIIKIDKVFVEAIGAEGHSRAIVDTLIDLAKNLRMEIIAEGVETSGQLPAGAWNHGGAGLCFCAAAVGRLVPAVDGGHGPGRRGAPACASAGTACRRGALRRCRLTNAVRVLNGPLTASAGCAMTSGYGASRMITLNLAFTSLVQSGRVS